MHLQNTNPASCELRQKRLLERPPHLRKARDLSRFHPEPRHNTTQAKAHGRRSALSKACRQKKGQQHEASSAAPELVFVSRWDENGNQLQPSPRSNGSEGLSRPPGLRQGRRQPRPQPVSRHSRPCDPQRAGREVAGAARPPASSGLPLVTGPPVRSLLQR